MPARPFDALVELLQGQEERWSTSLNLVASENVLSPAARWAMSGDLAHRYCIPPEGERPPAIWDYPNQERVRAVHALAERSVCAAFNAAAADVRPLSGNNAAYIVLQGLLRSGGTLASVPADCGGHFATAEICEREGIRRIDLAYDREAGVVDVARTAELCERHRASVVFLDASTHLRPHPVAELRAALGSRATLIYDASHVMGLIAARVFQDPLGEGADVLQGSTHKSLPGPQKGLFAFRSDDEVRRRIHETITPLFVSNAHSHHVAALCVSLEEMREFGCGYGSQVVRNARALARKLHERGERVLLARHGFTSSHQVVWVVGDRHTGLRQVAALEAAGLHVNLIRAPFTGGEHGFRLGASELTRRGMTENELAIVGDLLVSAACEERDPHDIAGDVAELSQAFTSVCYGYPVPVLAAVGSER